MSDLRIDSGGYVIRESPENEKLVTGMASFDSSSCIGVSLHGIVLPGEDDIDTIPDDWATATIEKTLQHGINNDLPIQHPSSWWSFVLRVTEERTPSGNLSSIDLGPPEWCESARLSTNKGKNNPTKGGIPTPPSPSVDVDLF